MTTTEETFAAQYPLALIALGKHIRQHGLAPLGAVDVVVEHDDRGHARPALQVRLPALAHEQDAWLATVHVDAEISEPGVMNGWHCAWIVRLPGLGFRLRLVGWREHPAQLLARVSA